MRTSPLSIIGIPQGIRKGRIKALFCLFVNFLKNELVF